MVTQQAFISGRVGRAVYVEANQWWVEDLGLPRRPARQTDIADTRNPGLEFYPLSVNSSQLNQRLETEVAFHDLLFLTLRILDPGSSLSTKLLCAHELEAELGRGDTFSRVLDRVLSAPLDKDSRVLKRQLLSAFGSFEVLHKLLVSLFDSQPYVDEVHSAWLKSSNAVSQDDIAFIKATFIQDGTFAAMVRACQAPDRHSYNSAMVAILTKRRDPRITSQIKQIVGDIRVALANLFFKGETRAAFSAFIENSAEAPGIRSEAREQEAVPRHSSNASVLSPFETKSRVDKQIEAIRQELLAGRTSRAEKFTQELAQFQSSHSEREHLAKSLCSLASFAISANHLDIADELSKDALNLQLLDEVIYTSRAEILKNMGLFAASLAQYAETKRLFPNSSYAVNGYADVLKESGRYEESLKAYQEAKLQFPDSPVPLNGYVSTLRAQGKRKEALEAAIEVVDQFPDDAVSKSTYASALASNGNFKDAAKHYSDLIDSGYTDSRVVFGYLRSMNAMGKQSKALSVVKRLYAQPTTGNLAISTAYVSQLRAHREIDKAIALSEEVLTRFPGYTPLKFQLAASLVAKGEFARASAYLPEHKMRSEADWAGYRIYLLSLIKQERFVLSKRLVENALKECAWQGWQHQFRTLLGFIELKLKNTGAAISTLLSDIDKLDEHSKQGRLVLLGAAQRSIGRLTTGADILAGLSRTRDPVIISFRDAALRVAKAKWVVPSTVEFDLLMTAA